MPKVSETSMFANDPSIRRRLIDFFSAAFARNQRFWGYVLWRWLHTFHQRHCSRVLLNRRQSFMRMQKQQRQLPGFSLGDGA
jgi:hypothetical protein